MHLPGHRDVSFISLARAFYFSSPSPDRHLSLPPSMLLLHLSLQPWLSILVSQTKTYLYFSAYNLLALSYFDRLSYDALSLLKEVSYYMGCKAQKSLHDRAQRLLNQEVLIVLRDGRELEGVILFMSSSCLVLRVCSDEVHLRVKIPFCKIHEILPADRE